MSNLFFGIPEGVFEGQIFNDRAALVEAGLHRSIQKGIDGNKEGAAAIVLSGGYEGDFDSGDEIIYTGEGGNNPKTGKQIKDQSWKSPGNTGLIISKERKLPVRVIRGCNFNSPFSPKHGYQFGGLFHVIESWETGGNGEFRTCHFKLRKINLK